MHRALRVFLATGDEQLDDFVTKQMKDVRVVKAVYYRDVVLEALADLMPTEDAPEVIMIGESLDGAVDMRELLRDIRLASFNTRVVYIFDDASEDNVIPMRHYLMSLQIYDTLGEDPDGYGPEEVHRALFQPRNPADVLRELSELERGGRAPAPTPPLLGDRREPEPPPLVPVVPVSGLSTDVIPVTAFWSAKGGEGVDTLAINAAVAVAKASPDLLVCLADFSRTPNVHLHFNAYDEERNFEEVVAQAERRKLSPYTLEKYVVEHPEIKNLHILVGSVQTINFDANLVGKEMEIESIISVLRDVYGCVILVTSSGLGGLDSPATVVALQKADQILMVVTEDHASFYNARRALDPEYGRLQAKGIDTGKVRLVLNKYLANETGLRERMAKTLGQPAAAVVPMFPEILGRALAEATPLMEQRDLPEEVRQGFEEVASLISPRFGEQRDEEPERVGFFRRLLQALAGLFYRRGGTPRPRRQPRSKPKRAAKGKAKGGRR